jgi:hypothetical protein
MGWTINFAHPMAWVAIVMSVVIAVCPTLLVLWFGSGSPTAVLAVLAASIGALMALAQWEASRSRE